MLPIFSSNISVKCNVFSFASLLRETCELCPWCPSPSCADLPCSCSIALLYCSLRSEKAPSLALDAEHLKIIYTFQDFLSLFMQGSGQISSFCRHKKIRFAWFNTTVCILILTDFTIVFPCSARCLIVCLIFTT